MKAMVRDAYGSADVLELRDIDIPEVADDEVLVRVHAAGVGRDVWHVMTGCPTRYASPATASTGQRTPSSARMWPGSWRHSART